MTDRTGILGNFSIRELHIVSEVLRRLRLGRAMHEISAELGDRCSPPALSRLLKSFSEACGLQLTERQRTRGGPLTLTTSGIEHFDRIIRAIEGIVAIVDQLPGIMRGQVRGLTLGFVGGLVPEFSPRLLEPVTAGLGFEISGVVSRPEDQIASALLAGSVDLMIIPTVRRRQSGQVSNHCGGAPVTATELSYELPLGILCKTGGEAHQRLLALSREQFEVGLKDAIEASPIALNCNAQLDMSTLHLLGVTVLNTKYEVSDYRAVRDIVAARDVIGFGTADHGRHDVTFFRLPVFEFPFVLYTTLTGVKPTSMSNSVQCAITAIQDAVAALIHSRSLRRSGQTANLSEERFIHNPYA